MPTKTWVVGEEVLAADFNTMVQRQVVATFPNIAARDAGIPAPTAGMMCYVTDKAALQVYSGTAWLEIAASFNKTRAFITSPTGTVGSTPLAIPGLTAVFTLPSAHYVKVSAQWHVSKQTAVGDVLATINEGPTALVSGYAQIPINGTLTISFGGVIQLPAGSHSLQGYLSASTTTANIHASASAPSWIIVEDYGYA